MTIKKLAEKRSWQCALYITNQLNQRLHIPWLFISNIKFYFHNLLLI